VRDKGIAKNGLRDIDQGGPPLIKKYQGDPLGIPSLLLLLVDNADASIPGWDQVPTFE
jgi:hypothetical protein